jgi:hypothetical protein
MILKPLHLTEISGALPAMKLVLRLLGKWSKRFTIFVERPVPANNDFKDLFKVFNAVGVEYLVVGAHAVIYYAEPRYTKDLDIWVNPSDANAENVWMALASFGAPLHGIQKRDFTDPEMIYQIGVAPNRIDILMGIAGLSFDAAYPNRIMSTYDSIPIPIIARPDLIKAKQAAARPQDLIDLERLQP